MTGVSSPRAAYSVVVLRTSGSTAFDRHEGFSIANVRRCLRSARDGRVRPERIPSDFVETERRALAASCYGVRGPQHNRPVARCTRFSLMEVAARLVP